MLTARIRAFTLLEVVVATGILGVSVLATLALQTALHRSAADLADQNRAASFGDPIKVELARIRDRAARQVGGDRTRALAALIVPGEDGAALRLVASRDGTRLVDETEAGDLSRGVPLKDQYYLIEIRPQPPPLSYIADAGFLAVSCRVRWPYRLPGGSDPSGAIATDLTQGSIVVLNLALTP